MIFNVADCAKGRLTSAKVLDYYEDPAYTDDDFMDPLHLNDAGARKLSSQIKLRLRL